MEIADHLLIQIKRPLATADASRNSGDIALDQTAICIRVHAAVMTSQSKLSRFKALACEQRARESTDTSIRVNWQELAMEWHAIANATARVEDDDLQVQLS